MENSYHPKNNKPLLRETQRERERLGEREGERERERERERVSGRECSEAFQDESSW